MILNLIFLYSIAIYLGLLVGHLHKKDGELRSDTTVFATVVLTLYCVILITMTAKFMVEYESSRVKARIINTAYETTYTAMDVYYADDIIEEIRQVKRLRIEINGAQ